MKKIVQKEVSICDHCGKEEYTEPCLRCGIEHCWECRETQGIEYRHSVHFQGTGDGYYCRACDKYLKEHKDILHSAYLAIKKLKNEEKEFYDDFKKRVDEAEEHLQYLLGRN